MAPSEVLLFLNFLTQLRSNLTLQLHTKFIFVLLLLSLLHYIKKIKQIKTKIKNPVNSENFVLFVNNSMPGSLRQHFRKKNARLLIRVMNFCRCRLFMALTGYRYSLQHQRIRKYCLLKDRWVCFKFLKFSNVDAAAKRVTSSSSSPNKSFSRSLSAKTSNSTTSSAAIFVVVQASPADISNQMVGLNLIHFLGEE